MIEYKMPPLSPGAPLLLQKAKALAVVITFLASSHGAVFNASSASSARTSERPIYLSDNGPDFATATADDVVAASTAALEAASRELGITQRVLATLRDDFDPDAVGYLDRLQDIFQFADANKEALSQVVDRITAHLTSARMQLLEDAPTARQWARLARAIDPEAELRLPNRFVQPPIRPEEISSDQLAADIAAAAWARSVTS
jgi:hypothetical protein